LGIKYTRKRFAAELCLDPLGELTALPRPPSWIKGKSLREGKRTGKTERGRRERAVALLT